MTESEADRSSDEYTLTDLDIARFKAEYQRGMVAINNPILHTAAKRVPTQEVRSSHIAAIVKRLYDVALDQRKKDGEDTKRRTLVGLAAPQIGEPYCIMLVDTTVDQDRKKYGELVCFINPTIVWRSRETEEGREGCFSAGPVWGLVRRPVAIKVQAYTPEGVEFTTILEDMSARIASHEIDHLAGIRFPERIRLDRKRHWVHTEELSVYVKEINHWKRTCTQKQWEQLKLHGLGK